MSMFACIRTPHALDAAIAIARAFSPRVERHGPGCVVCDVSGLGRLLGEPPAIGAEMWRGCEAADPGGAAAIAPTQMAARILAHAATGLTVVSQSTSLPLINGASESACGPSEARRGRANARGGGAPRALSNECWQALGVEPQRTLIKDPATALAAVPIRVLHAMLVSQRTVAPLSRGALERYARIEQAFEVFDRWGLSTLGDLASLPADALSARLGRIGVELRAQACGVDLDPLVPAADVPRFLERIELEWPIDGLEPLAFVLARLLEPLSVALERADRGAAAIHLDLRLVDRTTHARMLQLPAAIRDPRVLRTLLTLDLESHPPAAAIDIVTIEIDPAPARVVQYSLLERARPSAETLATLMARLSALVGETRVGAPALLDSHGPDAFELRRFNPAETIASDTAGRAAARRAEADNTVLRRFRPPIAVRVDVDHGRPARIAIARRGLPSGHVDRCAGPWRGSGDWWAHDARQWDRDEWDVALTGGSVCRLFRARDSGVWFLEGVID